MIETRSGASTKKMEINRQNHFFFVGSGRNIYDDVYGMNFNATHVSFNGNFHTYALYTHTVYSVSRDV